MKDDGLLVMDDHGPAVTEDDIARFEQSLGARLPDDYRTFLLTINGGRPAAQNATFRVGSNETVLSSFLSLSDPQSSENIAVAREQLKDQLPPELLAIGDDSFGSIVCIVLEGERAGEIWFFDTTDPAPENRRRIPWYNRRSEFTRLAGSFSEFLASLGPLGD